MSENTDVFVTITDDGSAPNDSSFGEMENVSLIQSEINLQQQANCSAIMPAGSATVVFKNDGRAENQEINNPDVSRYFQQQPKSPSGQQTFFASYDCKDKPSAVEPTRETPVATMKESDVILSQPALSKFFSRDKSGHDADGKAFFDRLATADEKNLSQPSTRTSKSADNLLFPQNISLMPSGNSEEEIYNIWIPSEYTQQALAAIAGAGKSLPPKEHFTKPTVIIEEEIEDPLKVLLAEVNSPLALQRKVLTANDVPQNEDGLKTLIDADCYHAAINLTTRMLKSGYGIQGQALLSPKVLEIWFTRIALFIKLGKFSLAEVEAEAFGLLDKPDLYYEFHPETFPGKKGSMVPFSFRLLLAQLSQYQGNHQVALNSLYRILHVIQKIITNLKNEFAENGSMSQLSHNLQMASLEVWTSREIKVLYSILNCVLSQKDYVMAVSVAANLVEKDTGHKIQLHSALGRIYLQLGDLKQAEHYFNLVASYVENTKDKNLEIEFLINGALLAVARNENQEAYKLYERGVALRPNDPMLVNNMAVCLLYMGELTKSLALLEKTIQAHPTTCLHEGILYNICTLYELESSHCTLRKQAMLDLVSKYVGDSFNTSCLKIPPTQKG